MQGPPCRCGVPDATYTGRPCCNARFVASLHRMRPALAWWYLREIKPALDPQDRERFRAQYRANPVTVSTLRLRAESCPSDDFDRA